jgi:cyclopropane fatty-acyl-phospholipid synthase-like methyltransferase
MGPALQRARTGQLKRLAQLTQPERVLIVGEGDGSFLLKFVKLFPWAQVTVVEPSHRMVVVARRRLQRAGLLSQRIQFETSPLQATELSLGHFDLIVTLFFFDNFEEAPMREFVARLRGYARPQAYWLLSDFCIPSAGWRRVRAQIWMKLLYRFFGRLTGLSARELPPMVAALEIKDFKQIDFSSHCGGLLFSALHQCYVR